VDNIGRREFAGSWLAFWLLFLTGIGLPLALLCLVEQTVEIHTEVKDGEEAFAKTGNRR
jgi:uncharacterized iron-regulated membrane protein